jgi:glyoxylase-like metal-dependent hydrolase (beta-lactamase superfamily II)
MFTLEALKANNGDCLLLHYGPPDAPRLIVIDGGPQATGPSIFDGVLKPRLKQIAELRGIDLPLPVELLMVSHTDDDHIGGVLKLLGQANTGTHPLVTLSAVWHNSFDDFLSTDQLAALAGFGNTSGSAVAAFDSHTLAAAAGVKQGLQVRDKVTALGITPNAGTAHGFVAAGDSFTTGGMTMTVLGPAKAELQALQTKFDAENPNLASMTAGERRVALAAFTDDSVANLSSIVVLAERNGKRMLLTGDARGDKILQGLNAAGLLADGAIEVDVLKVPHHGSDRNVSTDFFKSVVAKHYVFSGDGSHGNPDKATLAMLTEARKSKKYTMWFTFKLPHLTAFFEQDRANHTRNYVVEFRQGGATSLWVDLEEELTF